MEIVSGHSAKSERAALEPPNSLSESILFPNPSGDDLVEIHPELCKKVLRQVRTLENDGLVRVVTVVVVPIHDGARRPGSELKDVHATIPTTSVSQALGIRLFDIMLITVHGIAPKYSCKAVQHWMEVPTSWFACVHSSTSVPNLAIFMSESGGIPCVETYPASTAILA
jgi:hypothetical protein